MCARMVCPSANVHREHCIRQCIHYDALKLNYVVFCQDYSASLVLTVNV